MITLIMKMIATVSDSVRFKIFCFFVMLIIN